MIREIAVSHPFKGSADYIVDWTNLTLDGGFAYSHGRLFIGMTLGASPEYAIEHELGHRAFDLLSDELKQEAFKVFGKWIVFTDIAKKYKSAEGMGVWKRDDLHYTNVLTERKRVHEQAAEALRCYVMKKPLPPKAKTWAQKAINSL